MFSCRPHFLSIWFDQWSEANSNVNERRILFNKEEIYTNVTHLKTEFISSYLFSLFTIYLCIYLSISVKSYQSHSFHIYPSVQCFYYLASKLSNAPFISISIYSYRSINLYIYIYIYIIFSLYTYLSVHLSPSIHMLEHSVRIRGPNSLLE